MMECSLANLEEHVRKAKAEITKVQEASIFFTVALSLGSFGVVAVAAWLNVPLPYLVAISTGLIVACVSFGLIDVTTNCRSSVVTSELVLTLLDRMGKEIDRRF